MEGLIGLLVLAILAVPVLLVVALVSVSGLKRRVADLEAEVAQLHRRATAPPGQAPAAPASGDWMQRSAPPPESPPAAPAQQAAPAVVAPAPAVADAHASPPAASATTARPLEATAASPSPGHAPPSRAVPPAPARPDFVTVGIRAVKRWFSVGNVPVKIGMLVLLAGVAALLKYAADQGWMVMPPELKLAAVAVAALGALVFAWRKRESNRAFALSLQGGAIGVLLLVVFAAFKGFGLLPAGAAFALSVILVAGAGALAVLQDAQGAGGVRAAGGFPGADLAVHRRRQPRGVVLLLRDRQCGDRRDRLVSRLAGAQPARLRLHLRHRHGLGRAGLCAAQIRQHPAVPAAVLRCSTWRSRCCSRGGVRPAAAT